MIFDMKSPLALWQSSPRRQEIRAELDRLASEMERATDHAEILRLHQEKMKLMEEAKHA